MRKTLDEAEELWGRVGNQWPVTGKQYKEEGTRERQEQLNISNWRVFNNNLNTNYWILITKKFTPSSYVNDNV
jgi:hypothetical protein